MNGYNFTERTRKVLALAREEGMRLGHEHVAPEHILLGLVREGEGVAAAVLQKLDVDLGDLRNRIESRTSAGSDLDQRAFDLPYTSQAKRVLEAAMREAQQLNHSYVGTEHLLLGILRDEASIATKVLQGELGITVDMARAETLRLLGADPGAGDGSSRREGSALEFDIRVTYPDGRVEQHRCTGRFAALRKIASL